MKKCILVLAVCAAACFMAQPACAQQTPSLDNLTSKAYSSMKKDDVYVIMFTASYCGPCQVAKRELFPVLQEKSADFKNVHFYALDVEQDQAAPDGSFLKDRWGINGVPAFMVIYNDTVMFSSTGYSKTISRVLRQSIENKINALK